MLVDSVDSVLCRCSERLEKIGGASGDIILSVKSNRCIGPVLLAVVSTAFREEITRKHTS